ncbi:MAG: helix-turn-helix transcriptional regulator [Myxococcota bacterium]
MYDIQAALNDLARQLRACRARDGLTLQQLATRCGVAASTIHKIETQQMVPTVSVLLKVARGLGRRPQDLVRDFWGEGLEEAPPESPAVGAAETATDVLPYDPNVAAWRFDFAHDGALQPIVLEPGQRAILYIERGAGEFSSPSRRLSLELGGCVEIEGERFTFASDPADPARTLLIMSPVGRIARLLGPPNTAGRKA